MHVYLTRTSKEMHMKSDVFGLSNTERLHRNLVLGWGDDWGGKPATSEPDDVVSSPPQTWLNSLDSSHM